MSWIHNERDSISSNSKKVDNHVLIVKQILLIKVTIWLWFPKAGGRHVKPSIAFLENYNCAHIFIVLSDFFLHRLNNVLRQSICPFLSSFGFILLSSKLFVDKLVNDIFNLRFNFTKWFDFNTLRFFCHFKFN